MFSELDEINTEDNRGSIELGYEGRVGLHSLPGAEEFYDNQGMIE